MTSTLRSSAIGKISTMRHGGGSQESDTNHIGFIAWHIVRDEDTVLSYLAGEADLWLSGRWYERFAMEPKVQGTGMAPSTIAAIR